MSNHGYAKDFYLLSCENILKKLDDLEEANDCLRIQISAREEVCNRLESNWNILKEFIDTLWLDNKGIVTKIKDKIELIEQGSDSNNKELNEDARTKQDLLYECSSLESKLSNEIIKNEHLEQQCKKQKEVIDNINLIIKGLAYGGSEDYYMENFSKINELLKGVSE
jgi:hypothetical protein